jgi:thiosulfate/3-mercaptopyruvate sulfurtransferase
MRRANLRARVSARTSASCATAAAVFSATIDLFVLHQLGYDDLTLYDGSMGAWAKEFSLPNETDRKPMSGS